MRILISNDDGIESPGLSHLAEGLKKIADVTVVAPQRERSTSGHSLTLHKPLRMTEVKPGYYAVSGSPADCVYLATRFVMKQKPDMVVTGINRGANLGNDIYYSGTVAAAREGAYFGCKAIAFSLCLGHHMEQRHMHWESAVQFAEKFIPLVFKNPIPDRTVLNVNVPNVPPKDIKGVKFSRMGHRYYAEEIEERIDPRNRPYYWLGGAYKGFYAIPNSDCVFIDQGFISVTPLKVDSTDYDALKELQSWTADLS